MVLCLLMIVYYVICTIWFISILNTGMPTPLKEQVSKDKYGKNFRNYFNVEKGLVRTNRLMEFIIRFL